jgi:hypothetical protein
MIEIEILLTFVYFLECTVVQCQDALSIYWNRHGHECSRIWKLSANFTLIQCIKIVSRFFGPRYIGDEIYRGRLFLGPNLVSFNRTVLILPPPYCTHVSKDTGSSSCERKIFRPSVYFFSLNISNISASFAAIPSFDSFGQAVSEEKIFLEINRSETRIACGGHVC